MEDKETKQSFFADTKSVNDLILVLWNEKEISLKYKSNDVWKKKVRNDVTSFTFHVLNMQMICHILQFSVLAKSLA